VPSLSPEAVPYIMLAAVGIACVSAIFSLRSISVTAKAAQATLYVKLQERYASHEMRDDLRNVRSWRELHGPDCASEWARLYDQNDADALEVDKSRRRISHFFGTIADLYRLGLLSKRLARHFANYSGADLWFDFVEPMEEELARAYDKSQFDTMRSLRGSSRRQQPRWFRPVIVPQSSNATANERQ
jgi:hypothetical protein